MAQRTDTPCFVYVCYQSHRTFYRTTLMIACKPYLFPGSHRRSYGICSLFGPYHSICSSISHGARESRSQYMGHRRCDRSLYPLPAIGREHHGTSCHESHTQSLISLYPRSHACMSSIRGYFMSTFGYSACFCDSYLLSRLDALST